MTTAIKLLVILSLVELAAGEVGISVLVCILILIELALVVLSFLAQWLTTEVLGSLVERFVRDALLRL